MPTCQQLITVTILFLAAICPQNNTAQPSTDEMAQAIDSLMVIHANDTPQACEELFARQAADMDTLELRRYAQVAERILYTPDCNSQQRAAYRAIVRQLLQNGGDEMALLRYRYQYELLIRNNEGEPAENFSFTDTEGNTRQLEQIHADYTLLIFNDPDCDECAMLRQAIMNNPALASALAEKRFQVLAIYPDLPTPEWEEQMLHYPSTWIKGYAEDVSDLYDVRQLPSTYLLDTNHTVLARNASVSAMATLISQRTPAK